MIMVSILHRNVCICGPLLLWSYIYFNIDGYFVYRASIKYCSANYICRGYIPYGMMYGNSKKKKKLFMSCITEFLFISELEHLEFECRCSEVQYISIKISDLSDNFAVYE